MKTKIFLISAFFISTIIQAQNTFQKKLFGDVNIKNTCMEKVENNLFILGEQSTSPSSIVISKTDLDANIIWAKKYNSSNALSNGQFIKVSNNFYLIGTNHNNIDTFNIFVTKISEYGQPVWNYKYATNKSISLVKAINFNDTAIVIAGNIDSTSKKDIYLCMIDINGNLKWSKRIGENGNETVGSIVKTQDNNIALVGTTDNYENSGDILVSKINNNGELLWSKTYDITISTFKNQIGYGIYEDNKSQLLICGKTKTFEASINNQQWSPIVIKLKSDGDIMFASSYNINSGNNCAFDIKQKNNNEYVFIGEMGIKFALFISIDSTSNVNWSYYYSNNFSNLTSVNNFVISENEFILSGNKYNNSKDSLLIIKTNQAGISACNYKIPAMGVASSSNETPIVNNRIISFNNIITNKDTIEILSDVYNLYSETICSSGNTSIINTTISLNEIYPNPVNDKIYLDKIDDLKEYFVYDYLGKVIKHGNENTINCESFKTGLYFLKIQTNKGEIKSFKVIKD